jgi:hypothetical protein
MKFRILLFLIINFSILSETIQFTAEAYDLYSAKFLYTENHTQVWNQGKHISSELIYKDRENHVFAKKQVDYSSNPMIPDFSLEDYRTGYYESLKKSDKVALLKFRPNQKTALKDSTVPLKPISVAEGGFHYFIQSHFETLMQGKAQHADFIIPNALGNFKCFVIKVKESEINSRPVVTFRMTLSNWFYRIFVDDIHVTYDVQSRRLIYYEGISNIEDESKSRNYRVRIHFNYPKNYLEQASN